MTIYRNVVQSMLGILLVGSITLPVGAEVKLIAHPSVGSDQVSATDVKNFFLGRSNKWNNGQRAVCIVMDNDNAVHESFLKGLIEKSPAQFSAHWKKAVFTGTGEPPAAVASIPEMISKVAATPGGIGYIDGSDDAGSAKVLKVQ